jgi:hypothetical protein
MKKSIRIIHWIPRVICILAILFISIFSADAFSSEHNIWHQIGDFLMHLIPSFILLAFLIATWKWELIGGVIFTIIGVALSPFIYQHNYAMNESVSISLLIVLMITFPFIVVGVLFIISHFMKKKQLLKKLP